MFSAVLFLFLSLWETQSGKDATNDKSECVVKFSISRHQFSSNVYNNFPHFPVEPLVWRAELQEQ